MTFQELYISTFPGLSKTDSEKLHEKFSSYELNATWMYNAKTNIAGSICQGDIVSNVPVAFLRFGGSKYETEIRELSALILSNSCDCDRVANLMVLPLVNGDDYLSHLDESDRMNLKKNRTTDLIYLPSVSSTSVSLVGHMQLITHTPAHELKEKLQQGSSMRLAELTRSGYYFLLAKLTLHLLRPESTEVTRSD